MSRINFQDGVKEVQQQLFAPQPFLPPMFDTSSEITSSKTDFGTGIFYCVECGLEVDSQDKLTEHCKQHSREDSNPIVSFPCTKCEKVYNNKTALAVHFNIHTCARKFPCDKCDKMFFRRSSLFNHKKSHPKTDLFLFKCSICDDKFTTQSDLLNHETEHSDKNGFNNHEVQCFVCSAILSTKVGLKLHISQMHPDVLAGNKEKLLPCGVCGRKYVDSSHLKQHLKTHVAARTHACTSCSYIALTGEALRRHVDRIHLKLRKFECDICQKTFVSQPDRKLHMLRHYKTKPVECDECDQRFYSTRELRKHKWAHSKQKPFKCDDCGVAYAYTESLRKHMTTHLPEMISCDKCPQKFWSEKMLTRHYRSHPSNDHIYKCSDCDKYYKSIGCMKQHEKLTKHSSYILVCNICNLHFASLDLLEIHDRKFHKEISLRRSYDMKVFEDYSIKSIGQSRKPEVIERTESQRDVGENTVEVFIKRKNIITGDKTGLTSVKNNFSVELFCDKCSKLFSSSEDYYEHKKYVHGKNIAETHLLETGSIEVLGGSLLVHQADTADSEWADSVIINVAT